MRNIFMNTLSKAYSSLLYSEGNFYTKAIYPYLFGVGKDREIKFGRKVMSKQMTIRPP